MSTFDGRTYALIGHGDAFDRAIAVALAERGANIAIATVSANQEDEFAVASIANEVWAIGRQQFSFPINADRTEEVESFANEVLIRLHGCDALVLGLDAPYSAIHSFLSAIPEARFLWLARENIGEGAIHVADDVQAAAQDVIAALVQENQTKT